MTKAKITYSEAVAEIESILQQVEEGKLEVDELTEKVKRVTDLLKICRDKLQLSEKQIAEILGKEED